ncbi:MAG TPA: ferric reductase-like transmembrane domain-containing protein [Candidatus Dormibacteraeota bacterium]
MNNTLLWYSTRGAGAVSLVLLSAVVVLGILNVHRFETAGWPRFLTQGLHRNVSLLALVFLGVHIVTAVVDPFTSLGWLAAIVPFSSYYRTFWLGLGVVAFELLLAITVSSLIRRQIGLRVWRAIHWLAYGCWPVAAAHGLGTGTDSGQLWMWLVVGGCVGAVGFSVAARLLLPPRDPLSEPRGDFRQRVTRGPSR